MITHKIELITNGDQNAIAIRHLEGQPFFQIEIRKVFATDEEPEYYHVPIIHAPSIAKFFSKYVKNED